MRRAQDIGKEAITIGSTDQDNGQTGCLAGPAEQTRAHAESGSPVVGKPSG